MGYWEGRKLKKSNLNSKELKSLLFNALKSPGRTMGLFFFGYGAARILVELFREADLQYVSIENPLGYIIFLPGGTGLSMGQSLSLPMVIVGLVFFVLSFRKVRTNPS